MTISASGSSLSSTESLPSLLGRDDECVTAFSRNFRKPSSPETLPKSSPGLKSMALGVGAVCPSGYLVDLWNVVAGVLLRIAIDGIVIENTNYFGHGAAPRVSQTLVREWSYPSTKGQGHFPDGAI